MLALAGTAACLATLRGPGQALPGWLRATALPLGIALIASGCAYLALSEPLAWTSYVSGTLLLLWVTILGIALTVRRRHHGAARENAG
jgi:TRAP-type C4-dicarboxylate transport system permease small subunit